MFPSFGRGNTILGGAQNVTQAIPQPGGSNVLTQQVSPSAATFNPNNQMPQNPQMPQGSPMQQFTQGIAQPQGQQGQPKPPKPPQNPMQVRADLIVKALTSHLASLDKVLGGGGV